jgi:hypothetical protein
VKWPERKTLSSSLLTRCLHLRNATLLVALLLILCTEVEATAQPNDFWITESSAGYVFADIGQAPYENLIVGIEVGRMHHLNSRDALGGSVGIGAEQVSFGPRYRRWLNGSTGLDAGVAAIWTPGRIETVELQLGVMHREIVGLWTKFSYDFGVAKPGFSAGVKIGSTPGLISYGLGAIGAVVYLIAYSNTSS